MSIDINNNIAKTLDHLLVENKDMANDEKQMLLICGSFFIMSDVKQYFGQKQEIDTVY